MHPRTAAGRHGRYCQWQKVVLIALCASRFSVPDVRARFRSAPPAQSHYVYKEVNEDDGARTRNLRRDRPVL